MPGRKYNSGNGYRYGFNGKELDKDISEGGQDYGMRIYDGRLGRFLSVDPYIKSFSSFGPYNFANNSPLMFVDHKGGYAIAWHYFITKIALLSLGTSEGVARIVGHYASVFSDNPLPSEGKFKTFFILGVNSAMVKGLGIKHAEAAFYLNYIGGVKYEATKESQSTELKRS
jgi:RHS repeat-associated protein